MNAGAMVNGSNHHKDLRKLKLQDMDGLFMVHEPFFTLEHFRDTVHLQLEPGDVIVSTFPKCGTTWAQYIVWQIIHDGKADPPPTVHEMNNLVFPFLELNGVDLLKDRPHPWYLKVHLPYKYTPYHPQAKYIYVARNPKDCCVSYYPFLRQCCSRESFPEDLTFEEFFEYYIEGKVPWGCPIDHILSWYEHKDDPNVLFLTYEEMKEDPKREILKVAKFLGEEHERKLLEDEAMLNRIVKLTSFEEMKKLPYIIPSPDKEWEDNKLPSLEALEDNAENCVNLVFFRKGKVGDWRNHLTQDMARRLDQLMEKKLKSTYLYDLWKDK